MDFSRLLNIDFSSSNSTLSLPSLLMDALVPGYGNISQLIYRFFGIDVGYVVSGCLVVFGLFQGVQFLYNRSFDYISSYFTSSIYIEDDDALYGQVMKWVAEQRMTKVSRDLKAVSKWVSNYQDDEDELDDDDFNVLDEKGIFNFEKWAGNIPPRYEPNYGSDRFYHDGRYFQFSREKKENKWSSDDDESLVIRCFGRSTQPIKDLNHVKRWTLSKENKMTSVYRAPAEAHGGRMWNRQSCRPSRPMHTVSLEQQQKAKIVKDINEYLHPVTARWYASRGIPYRRGYLFHGPPGTGKTSLSFALAGIFGLPVYCISLNEVGLTESDLGTLFSQLPRRCIVLLEDIDSAGLRRDDLPTGEDETDPTSPASETVDGSEEGLTKISKTDAFLKDPTKKKVTPATKSLISLSGLLNIIDGAASHEGRVLIMTTNCPENLDPALIRPGRVDLQVLFTLATREQIRDIFTRMYSTEFDKHLEKATSKPSSPSSKKASKQNDDFLELLLAETKADIVDQERLIEMAEQFADQLPEGKFSPAEIQGYLLMRKRDPTKAVAEIGKWRDEVLESKRSGKKVVNVLI